MLDILTLLDVQYKTGRTMSGRDIGDGLKQQIQSSHDSIGEEEIVMVQCQNCKIVLQDVYFLNGCPNCYSKDFKEFSEVNKIVKE